MGGTGAEDMGEFVVWEWGDDAVFWVFLLFYRFFVYFQGGWRPVCHSCKARFWCHRDVISFHEGDRVVGVGACQRPRQLGRRHSFSAQVAIASLACCFFWGTGGD